MRISWEHDIDGLRTWADLEHHLGGAWSGVTDRRTGVVLLSFFDELHLDEPPDSTAAQRRALHRRGFRRRDERCWSWTPPEPVDLPAPPVGLRPLSARAWAGSQRVEAADRACTAQALTVLRDVYRCAPGDLVVTLVDEPEDAWEDDDAWADLDCAALDALFGRSG